MNESQSSFAFYAETVADRWEDHRRFCAAHPEIKSEIVATMRTVLSNGGRPSIDGAMYRLRERGIEISNDHRAMFSREIKAECPDLAPLIHPRSCELDGIALHPSHGSRAGREYAA
jgi:hypothetical protein